VSFDIKYLSGFVTEKYQIDLTEGFGEAKRTMENQMWNLALRNIGGDDQRIITINTNFENITFKHILLPAYISSYNYKGKLYRFLVNARTGEVQGERPWSSSKIALAIVGGLAVIMLLYLLLS
jgi:hypothetical protein